MNQNTFLIICGILIVIPLVVSCIKGNPIVGMVSGLAAFFIMAIAIANGASMFGVHVIGFLFACVGTTWSLHSD